MTLLQSSPVDQVAAGPPPSTPAGSPLERKRPGRSLSILQRIVVAAAALPLLGIVVMSVAGAAGLIPIDQMVEISLGLGEEPGMAVFAAMLWCSPIQWLVKRTQVPVRKILGILFSGYAVSNFAMFVVERGLAASLSAPFLVAGLVAMVAAIPLLLTSGRWAQRTMGMRNWRALHKLTYLIALALVLHLALIGEPSIGVLLIVAALVVRIPVIANALRGYGRRRHT